MRTGKGEPVRLETIDEIGDIMEEIRLIKREGNGNKRTVEITEWGELWCIMLVTLSKDKYWGSKELDAKE